MASFENILKGDKKIDIIVDNIELTSINDLTIDELVENISSGAVGTGDFQTIPVRNTTGDPNPLPRLISTNVKIDSFDNITDENSLTANELNASNKLTIGDYTFPSSAGLENQILKLDNTNALQWQNDSTNITGTADRVVRINDTGDGIEESLVSISDTADITGVNSIATNSIAINNEYTLGGIDGLDGQVLTTNGLGDVSFQKVCNSSTDDRLVRTDGTTGKLQDSGIQITDFNQIFGCQTVQSNVFTANTYYISPNGSNLAPAYQVGLANIGMYRELSDNTLRFVHTNQYRLGIDSLGIRANNINELVNDGGVTIDGTLVKDGVFAGRSNTTDALKLIDNSSSIANHNILLTPLSSGDSAGFFDTGLTYNPSLNQLTTGSVIANSNGINTDSINENTLNNGVSIDNILSRDLIFSNVEQIQINETPFSPGLSASDFALRGGTGNYGIGLFPSTPANPNFSGITVINSDVSQAGGLPNLACVQWNNGIAPQQRRMFFTGDFTQFIAKSGTTPMLNFLNNANETFNDVPPDTGISAVPILTGVDIGIRQKGVEKIVCYDNGDVILDPTGTTNVKFGVGGELYTAPNYNAPINAGFYTQTTPKTVSTGGGDYNIIGSGLGTKTIIANTLDVGQTFEVYCSGYWNNGGNQTHNLNITINGSPVLVSPVVFTANLAIGDVWEMRVKFVISSIGATGSTYFTGFFQSTDSGNCIAESLTRTTGFTIDTTINNTLELRLEPITGGVSATSLISNIKKVY